jgi:hypothetical protein
MKKNAYNILAAVNLALLVLWAAVLIAARVTQIEALSIVFVLVTVVAIIIPIVYTVVSVIGLVRKAELDKKLLASTYAVNFIWVVVLIAVAKTAVEMTSQLL